jgi:hypothetical protein
MEAAQQCRSAIGQIALRQWRRDRFQVGAAGRISRIKIGVLAEQPQQIEQPFEIEQAGVAMQRKAAFAVAGGADAVIQPRQFIALLYLLCAFALLVPRGRPLVVLQRSQRTAIALSIIVANAIALHVNTRRYVSGLSKEWLFDLNENVAWWWIGLPSPMTMWAVGTVGVAILVVLGVGAFRPEHLDDAREPAAA